MEILQEHQELIEKIEKNLGIKLRFLGYHSTRDAGYMHLDDVPNHKFFSVLFEDKRLRQLLPDEDDFNHLCMYYYFDYENNDPDNFIFEVNDEVLTYNAKFHNELFENWYLPGCDPTYPYDYNLAKDIDKVLSKENYNKLLAFITDAYFNDLYENEEDSYLYQHPEVVKLRKELGLDTYGLDEH